MGLPGISKTGFACQDEGSHKVLANAVMLCDDVDSHLSSLGRRGSPLAWRICRGCTTMRSLSSHIPAGITTAGKSGNASCGGL